MYFLASVGLVALGTKHMVLLLFFINEVIFVTEEVILHEERTTDEEKMKIIEGKDKLFYI